MPIFLMITQNMKLAIITLQTKIMFERKAILDSKR